MDSGSGNLIVKQRVDFEALEEKRIMFDLVVLDSGIPQKSASATVVVTVENVNDETPSFNQTHYEAAIHENAEANTPVVTVQASDFDEGDFGHVTYR